MNHGDGTLATGRRGRLALWVGGVMLIALGVLATANYLVRTEKAGSSSLRADGSERITQATNNESYQNPCFSPDGQRLIYTRWRAGYNRGAADVMLRDLATREEHLLVGDGDSANVNAPGGCWHGQTVTFASDRSGHDELWLIEADGGQLRQLTRHTDSEVYNEPVFSPDGTHLAFEIDGGGGHGDEKVGHIALVNLDGSDLRRLPKPSTTDDRQPQWSATDTLLFQRRNLVANQLADWEVVAVTASDPTTWSAQRNLTNQAASDETDATWSPDGQFVLASSAAGGLPVPKILAFPLAGGSPQQLTNGSDAEDGAPSPSPDGRWLAFESHRTPQEESPTDVWLKALELPAAPSSEPVARAVRGAPRLGLTFQWQLANLPVDTTVEADIYEIDGLDSPKSVVDDLHRKGRTAICYVNVGAWEDFRDDKDAFPKSILGKVYAGYPDERWLDIRQIDALAPILSKRFDTCADKGFDAVEADNVDGFEQDTGFHLTAEDQLRFNRWVATEVHARGMQVALKNDGTQAKELEPNFDLVVTEDCVVQGNCEEYAPFRATGKLHLNTEYTDTPITLARMCVVAREQSFVSTLKHRALDAFRETCGPQ